MTARRRFSPLIKRVVLLLFSLPLSGVCRADALEDAARSLAARIAAALPAHQAATLEIKNISSLSVSAESRVRRALEDALVKEDRAISGASAVPIRVVLSENVESYFLVGEIAQQPPVTLFVQIPKSAMADETDHSAELAIHREFLLEQPGVILDFAVLAGGGTNTARILVLGPEGPNGGPLPNHRPWPRDVRGWLQVSGDHAVFSLPGIYCEGSTSAGATWACSAPTVAKPGAAGVPWANFGGLAPDRNYFRSWMARNSPANPEASYFYTVAPLPDGGWIATGLDGRARRFDSKGNVAAAFDGWGSEIAGVRSACGSGRQILATRAADWTAPDAVQAYEISGDQAVPVAEPVEFAGPVMALWPSDDESYVRAVVKNLRTGKYEAYRLTITCGH